MNYILPDKAEPKHIETFTSLCDGVIHETTVENIRNVVGSHFTNDDLEQYVKTFTKPSDTPGFKENVLEIINKQTTFMIQQFVFLCNALDSRVLSPTLTNSLTLVKDMTVNEKEELIKAWRDSPIELKNKLFRIVYSVSAATFVRLATDLHNKATNYPGKESRETIYENQEIDPFKYEFLKKPEFENGELYLPDIDVLIIGSGAGAGVVAHTLANDGYKSLILEKGKYFHSSEYNFNDLEGMNELYEGGAAITTSNGQMFVLAGSTFGGGTTINWSCSLNTPFKIRKEWYDDYGLEFVANESYDKAQEFVLNQMGASTKNIKHSLGNQVILKGGKKLGYTVKECPQNSGGYPNHSCGFCYLGCKYGIKQGGTANWLKLPAQTGSKFMDSVKVLKILHKKGKAIGVLCQDEQTKNIFSITGPKKFVVAGGSLNTPVVLQNSGFKNKNIGSNLKLHPVTVIFGDFGKEVKHDHFNNSIMTAVCTQVDDLNNKAHGAKIETILNAPFIQATLLPWRESNELRKDLLRYNNMVAMLLIDRDTGSGKVYADKNKPDALHIDYEINKFDRNALLQSFLVAADMLYIEGAKRLLSPQATVPIFETDIPKDKRKITDKEYQNWRNKVSKIQFTRYGTGYGSAHQMSSCRMSGKGPNFGACDENGKLFECPNIYIADASAMPTASGANPMITTMTIARHVGLRLADDLKIKSKL
ncbi:unnamed protein product [Candida verbasci]|uniref:Long-chain-alcohol oxidase n=1 Tax=Candida verbasci TaxID=1227364 RepID=A0A9W4TY09_9ASCO|nr:unnamed protein product [Candida verbasci]